MPVPQNYTKCHRASATTSEQPSPGLHTGCTLKHSNTQKGEKNRAAGRGKQFSFYAIFVARIAPH